MPTTAAAADRLNYLNLAAMVGAAGLAYYLPLPLFLLSYAVLGPAHYLTEIQWLHRRRYFTASRWAPPALLATATLLVAASYATLYPALREVALGVSAVLLVGLLTAVLTRLHRWRLALFVGLLLALVTFPPVWVVLVVLLPTLVHVYAFTGAFLLLGTLRAPRVSAWLCCLAFVLLPAALLLAPAAGTGGLSWSSDPAFAGFAGLGRWVAQLLPGSSAATLTAATRFIAWAYCYHYLNWFTKTRHIGFLQAPRGQLLALAALWLASVALYAYDYTLGLRWLSGLSLLHVLLELPLNRQTLRQTTQHLATRLRPAA